MFPQTRIHTRKFLLLSYPSSAPQLYTQGIDDIYFVLAWVVNFTAIRAFAIERILRPIAGPLGVDAKSALRFAEQGWLVLYYGYFWTLGMVSLSLNFFSSQSLSQLENISTVYPDVENNSIFGTTPRTGWTIQRFGLAGQPGKCLDSSSGTISHN